MLAIPNREEKVRALANLMSYLPLANYTLLRCLAAHLVRIVQNCDLNKMTLSNIAIVFGPTLGIPIGLFVLILSEFEAVFCWTTLKQTQEEENIMSVLFNGPDDYLTVNSVTKAQIETRNKMLVYNKNANNKAENDVKIVLQEEEKNNDNVNNNEDDKSKKEEEGGNDSDENDVLFLSSENLISGSTKTKSKSTTNVEKAKISNNEEINFIKEQSEHEERDIRELSLGTEMKRLIDERCKHLSKESDDDRLESIMNAKEMSTNEKIKRQERCSSLYISQSQQMEYLKNLHRLSSIGEDGKSPIGVGQIKVFNRNSQEYMDGVPDNFRLSEMFAKEIKSNYIFLLYFIFILIFYNAIIF